ncbi:hypothetical protein J3Q64DRAFT_1413776 [Phycomyces blakesleeanus]|uniref:Uncharacterized protein n=1 Tax=Phycomyces blakesleeanus TaxID=4837 RepID=A0ABR3B6X9_PHYBL
MRHSLFVCLCIAYLTDVYQQFTERVQTSTGLYELSLSNQCLSYVLANIELAESNNRVFERDGLNASAHTTSHPTVHEPELESNKTHTEQPSDTLLEAERPGGSPSTHNSSHALPSAAKGLKRKREDDSIDETFNKRRISDNGEGSTQQDKGKG